MTIEKNEIVSFSGGKDSTAMALLMLERGIRIHSLVAFDGGWEFPDMLDHWTRVEQVTGLNVIILRHEHDFDYWMLDAPIRKRISGSTYGDIYRVGNGWPSPMRRWCTSIKKNVIRKYCQSHKPYRLNIGFASDEEKRVKRTNKLVEFPLVNWGITEKEAMNVCRSYGFDWNGLYTHFNRSSCFCCPLTPMAGLRTLREHYPDLWNEVLRKENMLPDNRKFFVRNHSAHDLDKRFCREELQKTLI